jgi:putative SOS response-associated peptidase YedK
MCGRFTRATEARAFTDLIPGLIYSDPAVSPRYNIAPTQQALIAREHPETRSRELVSLKWGLVPHWSKDAKGGAKMINARAETVASKPAFRDSFRYRRCLVAADGWYEWRVTAAGKTPIYIQRVTHDGEIAPFYFAGLWSSWRDKAVPDAVPLETFTILTREASPALTEVHDRMPVILPQEAFNAWLDHRVTASEIVNTLVADAVSEGFHFHAVSTRVNTPRNDDAACTAAAR